jgi:hypothetical protein
LFHDKRHPRDMGATEIEAFLTHLAVVGKVSAPTQNQAKSTLLFLYREVVGMIAVSASQNRLRKIIRRSRLLAEPHQKTDWHHPVRPLG